MCVSLRVLADQACRERDKVKADLDHADQRNLQLVREVDDRHASMENLNQSRIRSDSHVRTYIKQSHRRQSGTGWREDANEPTHCESVGGALSSSIRLILSYQHGVIGVSAEITQ